MSCELGSIKRTGPTGGSQHREHWGGPNNGWAAACRRHLAAVELAARLLVQGATPSPSAQALILSRYGQADEVSVPRGVGIPPGSWHLSQTLPLR